MLASLQKDIRLCANPEKAKLLQKFFKTGKGEYGEGDIFLGLTVALSRSIAKKYTRITLLDIAILLASKIHEERQIGLMILVLQFQKGTESEKEKIYEFYLAHTKSVNNWDLVDGSAGYIVGEWLRFHKDKSMVVLKKLAHSEILWERRIAIIATFAFIYAGEDTPTYKIAEMLVADTHDLIQKAVGWMLREAGKRVSLTNEEEFIKKNYSKMGRTTLRYAIERFPGKKRKQYLRGEM